MGEVFAGGIGAGELWEGERGSGDLGFVEGCSKDLGSEGSWAGELWAVEG